MAVRLLAHEVSDLCIGKPALRTLTVTATVSDALAALKRYGESYLSVWRCDHNTEKEKEKERQTVEEEGEDCRCRCVGKICIGDVICFLCKEENLLNPGIALQAPISALLTPNVHDRVVRHLEPNASLLQAIDLVVEGTQNLIIPIRTRITNSRRISPHKSSSFNGNTIHNNREYCWLTQEDIIRYLLNSIALCCPIPGQPINSLNIIDMNNILAVRYDDPASLSLSSISQSLLTQTSVAILDDNSKLLGELSPIMLNSSNVTVAAAIATLSAGDLMAYMDCGGTPDGLIRLVKERLEQRNLATVLEFIDEESGISCSSSSSDEEFGIGRSGRCGGYSARVLRRSEAIVCYPWSSLMAVMIQALAHRVSYVWVVEEDGTLDGIVTFSEMIKVFRDRLKSMV